MYLKCIFCLGILLSPAPEVGDDEPTTNTAPKANKKLSKKSSFLRSITIDLFRSKTKKVSKHHSVCESDLHNKSKPVVLRREQSDLSSAHLHPVTKPRGLFRSNSSCDNKTSLKPILKRQSSFNDHNRMIPVIKDAIPNPVALRRQNSLMDIEMEPKIKPILRRQNSLIEYNRRGAFDYQFKPFNMITAIDPLYQRKMEIKHEPYYPGKDTHQRSPTERIFQTKTEAVYGVVPKPERTYATRSEVRTESPYATRQEVTMNQTQCPYSSRQEIIREQSLRNEEAIYSRKQEIIHKTYESPYTSRSEMQRQRENPYGNRQDCCQQRSRESCYGSIRAPSESPYASRSEVLGQRSSAHNPYSTKEELLRQRLGGENPYGTKEDMLKQRISSESAYASKGELIRQRKHSDSSYASREEVTRYRMPESPYQTKDEMLRQRMRSESPYSTRDNIMNQRLPSENSHNASEEVVMRRVSMDSSHSNSTELRKQRRCSESSHSSRDERNQCRPHSDNMASTSVVRQKNTNQSLDGNHNNSHRAEGEEFSFVNNLATLRIGDNPHVTKADVQQNRYSAECSYGSDLHCKPLNESNSSTNVKPTLDQGPCICEDISSSVQHPCSSYTPPAESPYVTKQEILSQKAALLAFKEINKSQSEDRFEVIRLRNQAKKEMIYQSKIEAMMEGISSEPMYVSKRDLKDTVIYESQNELKEHNTCVKKDNSRHSPYDLSDVAHLSRRESLYQSKQEALQHNTRSFRPPGIDFDALRNHSQTDQEKQSLVYESNILKGEPMYQSRMPPKVKFACQDTKASASNFASATSMEVHYESECSMQFDCKPQSTPYASQDIDRGNETLPVFKCNNRSGANSSGEGHDTTVVAAVGPLVLDTDLLAVGQKGKVGGPEGPCTTWGIFDSEGGLLEDRSWGVSLLIPADAILPGVKQKIYFTVSDPRHSQTTGGPPIDMDKGK